MLLLNSLSHVLTTTIRVQQNNFTESQEPGGLLSPWHFEFIASHQDAQLQRRDCGDCLRSKSSCRGLRSCIPLPAPPTDAATRSGRRGLRLSTRLPQGVTYLSC